MKAPTQKQKRGWYRTFGRVNHTTLKYTGGWQADSYEEALDQARVAYPGYSHYIVIRADHYRAYNDARERTI